MKKIHVLLTSLVLCLIFVIPSAAAEDVTADRSISPSTVAPGETFQVSVVVTITGTIFGPVLNEEVPAGWTITEVDNDGATYNAADTSWIWVDELTDTTRTVVYEVTVPGGTAEAVYPVTGSVLGTSGAVTVGPNTVTGDNQVTVNEPSATPTATPTPGPGDGGDGSETGIAGERTISPSTVAPGETFQVSVDITTTGTVYGPILDEDVPAGWTVTVINSDGASYNAADTSWVWTDELIDTTRTVIYEVTVPDGTASGLYSVTGTVQGTADGAVAIGPNPVTGDELVTIAEADITGDRTIDPLTVAAGETFRVTVNVTPTGVVFGPILDEEIPTGWTVTEVDNDGATYNAADTSWVWADAIADTRTVVYEVTVPDGTADGIYPVTGTVQGTATGAVPIGPNPVTGDDQVTVQNKPIYPPSVEVTFPNGGETLCGKVVVTAEASDSDGFVTNVEFLISDDNGATWSHLADDSEAPYEQPWDTSMYSNGSDYLVKAIATDNDSATASDTSDDVFTVVNPCPGPQIQLLTGWNYISFPGVLDNATPEYVLDGLEIDLVMHYNAQTGLWEGVSEFEPRTAYIIKVSSPQTIVNLKYKPTLPISLQLYEGWNSVGLIGTVPGTETNDAETEFSIGGINELYSKVVGPWDPVYGGYLRTGYNQNVYGDIPGGETESRVYTQNYPMNRYEGHWIYMESAAVLE